MIFSPSTDDSYTAGIELSNSCRQYYFKRKQETESFKEKIQTVQRPKSALGSAMDLLKREMAGLMDQDLSLMEQLMTMNEKIEELKFQTHHSSKEDFTSSTDLSTADLSFSDDEDDLTEAADLIPNPLTARLDLCQSCESIFEDAEEEVCSVEIAHVVVNTRSRKSKVFVKQDSVDSGYEDDTESSDDCSSDSDSCC